TLRLVSSELRSTARLDCQVVGRPIVRGHTTRIGQIVLNLVVNAIHALGERGACPKRNVIAVRLFGRDGAVELQVADNGGGVPEVDRRRIFDPFFTTKAGEGTGLGLAICRSIAQELGGTLDVDTDPELGGALFRLR